MSNTLALFPTIDEEILDKLNVDVKVDEVYYTVSNEKKQLYLVQNDEMEYFVDDNEQFWSPFVNDLNFKISIKILNKNILFDENYGIITDKAVLGIGFVWKSKDSNQTKTRSIGILKKDVDSELKLKVEESFDVGEIKNNLNFELIVYLKELEKSYNYFNIESGTVLGKIWDIHINLEGDGSQFPVEIINDKNELLWKPYFNFDELDDEFDKEHISLKINKAHKDFMHLNVEGESLSPLMKEIIIEFIYLFMCEIKSFASDLEYIVNQPVDEEKSIANVLRMWVKTFNIDFSCESSIFQSIRKSISKLN